MDLAAGERLRVRLHELLGRRAAQQHGRSRRARQRRRRRPGARQPGARGDARDRRPLAARLGGPARHDLAAVHRGGLRAGRARRHPRRQRPAPAAGRRQVGQPQASRAARSSTSRRRARCSSSSRTPCRCRSGPRSTRSRAASRCSRPPTARAPSRTPGSIEGVFKIGQTKGAKPITELKLAQPLAALPQGARRRAPSAKKPKSRKLWGDGKGSFRTRGNFSSATVRGTKWVVTDRCGGTADARGARRGERARLRQEQDGHRQGRQEVPRAQEVSWVSVLAGFLVAHMVGDYLLQTDWQARNKRGGLAATAWPAARSSRTSRPTRWPSSRR